MDRAPFLLGGLRVDPATNSLTREAQVHQLEPRLMKLLLLLVQRRGEVVSKDDIAAHVWDDQYITSETVSVAIYALRKALGDSARQPRFIKTIRKMGFQLIAAVDLLEAPETPTVPPRPEVAASVETPSDEAANDARDDREQTEDSAPERFTTEAPDPAADEEPDTEDLSDADAPTARPARTGAPSGYVPAALGALALIVLLVAGRYLLWSRKPQLAGATVAVMPFSFMAEDRDQAYFAEGMTEALITDLARAGTLQVLPRRSVLAYAASAQRPRDIGTQLGADFLLEGGVQVLDDQVVVTVQIIEVAGERHLWAQSYRKPITEFFRIQVEASSDLVHYFAGAEAPATQPGYDALLSATAYHAYLKGRHLLNSNRPGDVAKAPGYFKTVLKSAPDFAPAHASLATCYTVFRDALTDVPEDMAHALAEQHITRGLALDPGLAELHVAHGIMLFRDAWQWEQARTAFARALTLHEGHPEAHRWYGLLLAAMGRGDEALKHLKTAADLAPRSVDIAFSYIRGLGFAGHPVEARDLLARFVLAHPRHGEAQLLQFLLTHDPVDEQTFFTAFQEWVRGLEGAPDDYHALRDIRTRKHLSPRTRATLLRRGGRTEHVSPVTLAALALRDGQTADALVWLQWARRARDPRLVFLAVDPVFAPLHDQKAFGDLCTAMGLPTPTPKTTAEAGPGKK